MKIKTMLASLVAVVSMTACEDLFEDGSLQPDGSSPSVTINKPTSNQSVAQAEGLRVSVTTVDKDKVKDLEVIVKGVGNERVLVNFKKFPDKDVMEFDTLMALPNAVAGDYTLYVNATDYRTNTTRQEVNFTVR